MPLPESSLPSLSPTTDGTEEANALRTASTRCGEEIKTKQKKYPATQSWNGSRRLLQLREIELSEKFTSKGGTFVFSVLWEKGKHSRAVWSVGLCSTMQFNLQQEGETSPYGEMCDQ